MSVGRAHGPWQVPEKISNVRTEQARHIATFIAAHPRLRIKKKWLKHKVPQQTLRKAKECGLVCWTHGARAPSAKMEMALEVAYSEHFRSGSLSAIFGIDKRWIVRMQRYVAHAFLATQLQFFGGLIRRARAEPPTASILRICWDESTQKTTLPVQDLSAEQGGSAYPIMLLHLRLTILWGGSSFTYQFVLPPLVVLSSAAPSMYNAMFYHQTMLPVWHAFRLLSAESAVNIRVFEADGAAANDRLYAALLGRAGDAALFCWSRCLLHAAQLAQVLLMSVAGAKLLSRLYSLTLFLKTSGYFLRMIRNIPMVVKRQCCVREVSMCGQPPAWCKVFRDELLAYMVDHKRQSEIALRRGEGDAGTSRGMRMYQQDIDKFSSIFNGPLYEANHLVHYCSGCCKNRRESEVRMLNALKRIVMRAAPAPPTANKWTSLGPVLDVLVIGFLTHAVFVSLFLTLKVKTADDDQHDLRDMDVELWKDCLCFWCVLYCMFCEGGGGTIVFYYKSEIC